MNKNFYKKYKVMSEAEVQRLLPLAQSGDIEARDKILEGFLKFVGYINCKLGDSEDGFQAGCIGLLCAIKKYDLNRKEVKFSFYAAYWIKQKILRTLNRDRYQISYNLIDIYKKYNKLLEENPLLQDREIIEKLEIKNWALEVLKNVKKQKISLQHSYNEVIFEETVGSNDNLEKIENMIDRDFLIALIEKRCTSKEKEIIYMLYFYDYTESELAKKLKISRAAINQLKRKALLKLRKGIYETKYN